MAVISKTINSIEQKAQLLIEKLKQLENENQMLLVKNKELTVKNKAMQGGLLLQNSGNSHLEKHKIAQEEQGTERLEQNNDLRTEIDQYILEIDKCIEWLQNQGQ